MTREEAIECLTFQNKKFFGGQSEALMMAISALEQESCEDEYIKVPKKALRYRTAGMIAYNVEWLKNHFDIERAVICGAQESCKGEWIEESDNYGHSSYFCSRCGTQEGKPSGFCPNCGADMREPKGEKKSCNTCKNSDDEFSGECYECVKHIQNHYEPEDKEEEIWCTECPYFKNCGDFKG